MKIEIYNEIIGGEDKLVREIGDIKKVSVYGSGYISYLFYGDIIAVHIKLQKNQYAHFISSIPEKKET